MDSLGTGRYTGQSSLTPFKMSNITRMATQNSSKSRFPSPSTSARSQTLSSWSSRRPLFFSTGAACSPVKYLAPFVRTEKMFQYVSISCDSIRGAMLFYSGGQAGRLIPAWGLMGRGRWFLGACRKLYRGHNAREVRLQNVSHYRSFARSPRQINTGLRTADLGRVRCCRRAPAEDRTMGRINLPKMQKTSLQCAYSTKYTADIPAHCVSTKISTTWPPASSSASCPYQRTRTATWRPQHQREQNKCAANAVLRVRKHYPSSISFAVQKVNAEPLPCPSPIHCQSRNPVPLFPLRTPRASLTG